MPFSLDCPRVKANIVEMSPKTGISDDTEVKSVFEQGQRCKGSSGFFSLPLAEQRPQHAFPHPVWFLSILHMTIYK